MEAIDLYVTCLTEVLPYVVVFSVGNMIVRFFLSAAFSGKVEF